MAMSSTARVTCVVGTRPEVVKMAPVIAALRARAPRVRTRVIFTAQHRGLLDQMAAHFALRPDADFDLMRPGQGPGDVIGALLPVLAGDLAEHRPDVLLAQGDTATVVASALASYHAQVPFGHVEAGLRSGDLAAPFPEEGYRRMVSSIAAHHFAPTEHAANNLRAEGIDAARIHVTGNPVVDALFRTLERPAPLPLALGPSERLVVATLHRREAHGARMTEVAAAMARLLDQDPGLRLALPVHPNPAVRAALRPLAAHPRASLLEPLDYPVFVSLLARASLAITDSGGVQEEAPALGVPVLVARDTTERPEGVMAGCAELVGAAGEHLVARAMARLEGAGSRTFVSPYGDGHASERIADILERELVDTTAEAGARWAA